MVYVDEQIKVFTLYWPYPSELFWLSDPLFMVVDGTHIPNIRVLTA